MGHAKDRTSGRAGDASPPACREAGVTQRGNRRTNVFFEDSERRRYLWLLEDYARKYGLGKMVASIRPQTMTGRPSGSKDFIARLEGLLGRILHPKKPGPKRKETNSADNQG